MPSERFEGFDTFDQGLLALYGAPFKVHGRRKTLWMQTLQASLCLARLPGVDCKSKPAGEVSAVEDCVAFKNAATHCREEQAARLN
eukprot:5076783-Amphidinium_carterae.1